MGDWFHLRLGAVLRSSYVPQMDMLEIILVFIALLIGTGAGWFFGSRPVAEWQNRFAERDGEAKEAAEKISRMAPELATMSDRAARADALAERLDRTNEELTGLKAQAAGFAEQKRLLEESREKLLKEFENTGAQVLGKAQEAFLNRANERFKQSEEAGEQKIKALLEPVGSEFAKLSKKVEDFDQKRVADFGNLSGLMQSMKEGQDAVRAEAAQLGSSLRNAPKTRGRWGEQQLKNVLEQCGLAEHTDFETEVSTNSADGTMRPDAIVNIPGDKKLVIDSKVSLTDFQNAFSAETEEDRLAHLSKHAGSMKAHINSLSGKNYQAQFKESPDYVIMFVPGENFLNAALDVQSDLWEYAFKKRVLLATPTNLVAIARTVATVWQQKRMSDDATEIAELARLMFDSLAKVTSDFHKMGRNLGLVVKNYNEFGKTLEGNLSSRARRLSERYVDVGSKALTDPDYVEEEPRYSESAMISDQSSEAKTS